MSVLIRADDLAAELADRAIGPDLIVLDAQYNLLGPPGRELYAAAHLAPAAFVDVDIDLADPPGRDGRHPLPDMDRLQATLRRVGIDDGSRVVVYDQGTGLGAARAWWLLGYVGVRGVRVLDGGLTAWQRAGRPVTADVPAPRPAGHVTVRPGSLPTLTSAGAAELARTGLLLDARSPERFAGRVEPIDAVAGHIPGAVNAPMAEFAPEGSLPSRERLHAYFAGLGAFDHESVGAYCGSGITAAYTALALREIGITAAVYVGSWSEWITDPDRPIATS